MENHLGIINDCPGRMTSPEIPFARRRALRETPCFEAIRLRLSPFLTVYFTNFGFGFGLGFTTTGLGFGFGAVTTGAGRGSPKEICGGCSGSAEAMTGRGFLLAAGADGRYHLSGLSAQSST